MFSSAITYTVSSSAVLAGVTAASFGLDAQAAFATAVALTINVSSDSAFVDSVTNDGVRRRVLLGAGAKVGFSVVTPVLSASKSISTSISAISTDPSTFATALGAQFAALPAASNPGFSGVTVAPPVSRLTQTGIVNVSAVSNVSAATAAVAATFAQLSVADAVVQQETYLTSLASGTVNLTADTAHTAVSFVLSIVNAANVTLSDASQSAALDMMSRAAASPINASSSMAQDVVSVLAVVANSVTLSSNGTAQSQNALQAVTNVVETLTISQASALNVALAALPAGAPPPAPAVTSTPLIQTLVQIDPPGSNRLTTQPLTAPGSPSSFQPMPADLLANAAGAVVTQFFSLAFDPNRNANSTTNTTGLTRLAFNNPDGSPIVVANASKPILFTLPFVNVGDGQAVCSFWDTAANTYSTRGCAGVPNPAPPGHALFFVPGFNATSDSALALSWNLTGPLVDDGACRVAVLDCNVEPTRKVYPDPKQPLVVPAVSCPPVANGTNATRPVLRVFYGTDCQLWQDNALNCSWDNVKQAFVGGGCVPVGNTTQCMCRHLTDFTSARPPKVATCSLSDMTSLSAGDIITKLRFLFIVVITLFSVMNVGAIIGFVLDVQERRATLAKLLQPEMGFEELDGGVWTWRCVQEPLTRAVAAPAGSAMHLASVLGLPFVRLRAALPECAFAGSVGQALGRREGLSVNGFQESRGENVAVMTQLLQALSCCGVSRERIPAFAVDDATDKTKIGVASQQPMSQHLSSPRAHGIMMARAELEGHNTMRHVDAKSDASAETLIGTALVFAFLTNAKVLPVVEHARRLSAAATHFAGVTIPGIDRDFEALHAMFTVMLSEGNLTGRSHWLEKSRLWRFILLQRTDGSWDVNNSLAFALQAHEGARPPRKPPQSKLRAFITTLLGEDDLDDALDEALDDALTSIDDEESDKQASADASAVEHVKDCPLTFSESAVRQRMPPALAALNHEYDAAEAEERAAKAAQQARIEAQRAAAEQRRREEEEAMRQAMREAVAVVVEVQGSAPGQLNTPAALQGWVDGAMLSLQQKLEFLTTSATALPEEPHVKRQHEKLIRSVSGKVERLNSVRLAMEFIMQRQQASPPAPAPTPATPLTLTSSASRTRRPRHARVRVPVEGIWATILAVNVLEELDSCWQCDEEDEAMRTIVDRGHEYLRAQGRAHRSVRKLLKSHALEAHAERTRRDWKAIHAANVAALRDTDVINKFTALTHIQRASARIVRSMMVDHSTFATFLDTDGYIMRWQRFMILTTIVLTSLLTSIWFYCA